MHITKSFIHCWCLIHLLTVDDFIKKYSVLQRPSQLHLADIVKCIKGNSFAWFYHWLISDSPFILIVTPFSVILIQEPKMQSSDLRTALTLQMEGIPAFYQPQCKGSFQVAEWPHLTFYFFCEGNKNDERRHPLFWAELSNCCKVEGLERSCATTNN